MTSMTRIRPLISAATVLLVPVMVNAEPSKAERESAKHLYEQAAKELDEGNYQSACAKFESALTLTPEHIRTGISLGECHAKWGKTATALMRFEEARKWAEGQGKSDKVQEIDALIANLNGRLARLRIIVPSDIAKTAGIAVQRGETLIGENDWGKALPVDPGTYDIEATAPNLGPWSKTVEAKMGQTVEVKITPSWLAPSGSPWRTLGFVGIGLGATGLIAGSILGGVAISTYDESKRSDYCNQQSQCIREGFDLRIRAQQLGNASTGVFVAGGLLTAAGLTAVLLTREPSKGSASAKRPTIEIGLGGIAVRSSW
jgi:tetratricopeptide (TPR) repeat protein